MGIESVVLTTGGRPDSGVGNGATMVNERLVVPGGAAVVTGASRAKSWTRAELRRVVRTQTTSTRGIVVGSVAVFAAAFLHPLEYQLPTLRATVETAITLLALTGAWLLRARFAQTARIRDLLHMAALLMLGLLDLFCNVVPSALGLYSGGGFAATRGLGDLLVAATFAAAAFVRSDRVVANRHGRVATAGALCLAAVGVCELGGMLLRNKLVIAAGHPVTGIEEAATRPLTCLLVLATAGLLGLAAVASSRGRGFNDSGAGSLLAGGLVLLAGARALYFALPSLSDAWISPRDGLRLVAVAMLLAAAVRQELQMRGRTARAAAIAERHRVAEDLHDGIAQDLAFIAAHGARMASQFGDEHPVTIAARRALAISRGTISELSDMSLTTADDALEAIAHELRDRFEIAITVYAHPDAYLRPDAREHVARIVREAIANAARHGGAGNVSVSLRPTTTGVSLRVCDDGCGIPGNEGESLEGFGLRSMRERAATLGGCLTVRPRRSGGTELEVLLP